MTPSSRTVRVARKTIEANGICSFELVGLDDQQLPAFSAGSHIDVQVGNGLIRQYSLCNDPAEMHRYVIAVLRDPVSRGGSEGMHAIEEGQFLQISDPRNHFPLAHGAEHSILIAGGIGVTPLLCMAQRLANIGASFELHYCARSRESAAFVERMSSSTYAPHVTFHFDDGPPGSGLDVRSLCTHPKSASHIYVCGPTGFMDWILDSARQAGWGDANLHREYFAAAPIDTAGDTGFDITIASTGMVIPVRADESAVQALAGAGIDVMMSCEQGVCGTCVTRILAGVPDHRDMYLTPEEHERNDQFTPCCSRSKTPGLVLDL